jgi:hypothetical protein
MRRDDKEDRSSPRAREQALVSWTSPREMCAGKEEGKKTRLGMLNAPRGRISRKKRLMTSRPVPSSTGHVSLGMR